MKVNIYLSPPPYPIISGADFHIGVEKGALFALSEGITLNVAIGDFDSISESEVKTLEAAAVDIIRHSAIKDQTDAQLALAHALSLNPTHVFIHTSSGSRIDHLVANLRTLVPGKTFLVGPTFKAYVLSQGTHAIHPTFKYISFFAFQPVKDLTLKGFKYTGSFSELSLNHVQGISNEGSGTITFLEGEILVIESKD